MPPRYTFPTRLVNHNVREQALFDSCPTVVTHMTNLSFFFPFFIL